MPSKNIKISDPTFQSWLDRLDKWCVLNGGHFPAKSIKNSTDKEGISLTDWLHRVQQLQKHGYLTAAMKDGLMKVKSINKEEMRRKIMKWERGDAPVVIKPLPPVSSSSPSDAKEAKERALDYAIALKSFAVKFAAQAEHLYTQAEKSQVDDRDVSDIVKECSSMNRLATEALANFKKASEDASSSSAKKARIDLTKPPQEWLDIILENLKNVHIGYQSRENITPDGGRDKANRPRGLSLGLNCNRRGELGLTRISRQHKDLVVLLCDFMRRCKPEFMFSSIQIVKDYASVLHVDGSNLGPSYIIGLGDYEGGQLYVHGIGKVDIKNILYCFDGNIPHLTTPIQGGQRFSIIFYTNQKHGQTPQQQREELIEWGVNLPAKQQRMKEYGPKNDRLKAARAALPAELAHCVCQRGDEKPISDQDLGQYFSSGGSSSSSSVQNIKETSKQDEESIDDASSDEDSDIEVCEENELAQVLALSRSHTGAVPQSDSQDEDLRRALQDSAKGFEEQSSKIVDGLCHLVGCAPEIARNALKEADFDETTAAMRLLEEHACDSASSSGSTIKCESVEPIQSAAFPRSLQRQQSCPPGAQGARSSGSVHAECVVID